MTALNQAVKSVSGEASAKHKAPANRMRKVDIKKAEKRRRILAAANATFERHGYEAGTVREIAREAGVALGTVSLYADDKWTLALMAFDERLDGLTETAVSSISYDHTLLQNLVGFASGFFEEFADFPHLAQVFMRMSFFYADGQSDLMLKHFSNLTSGIGKAYDVAVERNEILPDTPRETFIMLTFHILIGALRAWIAKDSKQRSSKNGIREVEKLFAMQVSGVT